MAKIRSDLVPTPGEQIRSQQKDNVYVDTLLTTSVNDVCRSFFGNAWLVKYRDELEMMSTLGYFLLTSYAGYQTVGEEYMNLVQIKPGNKLQIPSLDRRLMMVLLHSCGPYLINRSLKWAESKIESNQSQSPTQTNNQSEPRYLQVCHRCPDMKLPLNGCSICKSRKLDLSQTSVVRNSKWRTLTDVQKRKLLAILRISGKLIIGLQRLYLIYFYIGGGVNHLAKWITNIRYVRSRPVPGPATEGASYRWLGYLTLLPLLHYFYSITMETKEMMASPRQPVSTDSKSQSQVAVRSANHYCVLCLERANHITATPCGHVFCWLCIHRWCKQEARCPTCRQRLEPSRLVYLRNHP